MSVTLHRGLQLGVSWTIRIGDTKYHIVYRYSVSVVTDEPLKLKTVGELPTD